MFCFHRYQLFIAALDLFFHFSRFQILRQIFLTIQFFSFVSDIKRILGSFRRVCVLLMKRSEIIKTNSCSVQLRLKFILPINVKILTFISRMNTGFGDLNLKLQFNWAISSFMSSFELSMKKVL